LIADAEYIEQASDVLHDMSMTPAIQNLRPLWLEYFEWLRLGISDHEDEETDAVDAEKWHRLAKLSLAKTVRIEIGFWLGPR
jgi:hypothetical protein